jgi:hypothetical protein
MELPIKMYMEREVDINTEMDTIMHTGTGKDADMGNIRNKNG